MKNLFFTTSLFFFLLLGYSCNSDNPILDAGSDENLHEVVFNISNFSSEITDMSTKSTLANSNIKYIRYVVWNKELPREQITDEKTIEVNDISSPLKLRLRKGSYTIGIFASEQPIVAEKVPDSRSFGPNNTLDAVVVGNLSNPNQFHTSFDIEVDDTDIQKDIALKRTVGKITLAISDLGKAPSNVKTIVPVLVLVDQNSEYGFVYYAPRSIITTTGLSTFEGNGANYLSTNYLYINRSRFETISESNPLDYYTPQTINVDYNAFPKPFGNARYDLYLQGVTTDKVEYMNLAVLEHPELLDEEPSLKDDPNTLNSNIVFMTCIKRNLVIKPNEQVLIKGQLFKDNQLSVVVNNTWGETIDVNF